jgi:hypothetical protein
VTLWGVVVFMAGCTKPRRVNDGEAPHLQAASHDEIRPADEWPKDHAGVLRLHTGPWLLGNELAKRHARQGPHLAGEVRLVRVSGDRRHLGEG